MALRISTDSQHQIAELLRQGFSHIDIADRLNIERHTVGRYAKTLEQNKTLRALPAAKLTEDEVAELKSLTNNGAAGQIPVIYKVLDMFFEDITILCCERCWVQAPAFRWQKVNAACPKCRSAMVERTENSSALVKLWQWPLWHDAMRELRQVQGRPSVKRKGRKTPSSW